MKIAYAGSFDPFTNGHLHIVGKVGKMMPEAEVVILVANNTDKRHNFTAEERVSMINSVLSHDKKCSAVVLPSNKYAVEYAKSIGCDMMVRGIRTEKDFQDESSVYNGNKIICPSMETIYIMPDISLSAVRSSLVMSLIGFEGWLDVVEQLVPKKVFMEICKKYCLKTADVNKRVGSQLNCYDNSPYHNWKHIAYCMTELISTGNNHPEILRGILLHDAVNPSNKCDLIPFVFDGVSAYDTPFIWDAVAATDHENLDVNHLNCYQMLVHDIDMSILASRAGVYTEYTQLIRKEYVDYKHIPLNIFIGGRKDFIIKLLKKDRIFLTDRYNEDRARENLRRELRELEK